MLYLDGKNLLIQNIKHQTLKNFIAFNSYQYKFIQLELKTKLNPLQIHNHLFLK